jgi:hypothetical protein
MEVWQYDFGVKNLSIAEHDYHTMQRCARGQPLYTGDR